MPRSLHASDLTIGLLTENTPRMLGQVVRVLRSIRWFGGEIAQARIVACGVVALEANARKALEGLGAEVRIVSRFHPANPTANRHQLLAELLDAQEEVLLLLDCDTTVVQDPLPYLHADAFQGKIAPTPTITDEVFERLFAHFNLAKPARTHVGRLSDIPTIPDFNACVLTIPLHWHGRSRRRGASTTWRSPTIPNWPPRASGTCVRPVCRSHWRKPACRTPSCRTH